MNISYFSHFTSNISGQQCTDLEAALTWKTCNFGLTKNYHIQTVSLTKTIDLYCDLWKLFCFQMNRDNSGNSIDLILVSNVLCLLSDYRKEEIIRLLLMVSAQEVTQFTVYTSQ